MDLIKMPRLKHIRSWSDAAAHRDTKGEVAEAVAYFRGVLGERWPGWERGYQLANEFHTAFQMAPREWVRLHQMLQVMAPGPALEFLVCRQLGGPGWTSYVAGVMTLEFCSRFLRAERRVSLVQNDHTKSVDAVIHVDRRPVIVECKALHPPDDAKPWEEFYDFLAEKLLEAELDPSTLDVDFAPGALKDGERITEALIDIARARDEDGRDLPANGGRARFTAKGTCGWGRPVTQKDDVPRIVAKLKSNWSSQLVESNGPSVLAVRMERPFSIGERGLIEAAEAARMLLTELPKRKMVSGVLAYQELFLSPPTFSTHKSAEYRLVRGPSEGGHHRTALLVANPEPRVALSGEELEAFVGPSMLW